MSSDFNSPRDFLFSVRPPFADQIVNGEKTVELRRRFPESASNVTAVIYCTSPVQAIIGLARIQKVERLSISTLWRKHRHAACVDESTFRLYFNGLSKGFAITLTDAVAFEKKIDAKKMRKRFAFRAPQSFAYVPHALRAMIIDERSQIPDRHQHLHRA